MSRGRTWSDSFYDDFNDIDLFEEDISGGVDSDDYYDDYGYNDFEDFTKPDRYDSP